MDNKVVSCGVDWALVREWLKAAAPLKGDMVKPRVVLGKLK